MKLPVKAANSLVLAAMLLLSDPLAVLAQQAAPLRQSFDLQVPWLPAPVNIGGQRQLVYELHL